MQLPEQKIKMDWNWNKCTFSVVRLVLNSNSKGKAVNDEKNE